MSVIDVVGLYAMDFGLRVYAKDAFMDGTMVLRFARKKDTPLLRTHYTINLQLHGVTENSVDQIDLWIRSFGHARSKVIERTCKDKFRWSGDLVDLFKMAELMIGSLQEDSYTTKEVCVIDTHRDLADVSQAFAFELEALAKRYDVYVHSRVGICRRDNPRVTEHDEEIAS